MIEIESNKRKPRISTHVNSTHHCPFSAGHGVEVQVSSQNRANVPTGAIVPSRTGKLDDNLYLREV